MDEREERSASEGFRSRRSVGIRYPGRKPVGASWAILFIKGQTIPEVKEWLTTTSLGSKIQIMAKRNNGWYTKFAQAFHEVVVPVVEDLEKRLKEELASKADIDRLERKLDAQQERLDGHDKRIQVFEERASS